MGWVWSTRPNRHHSGGCCAEILPFAGLLDTRQLQRFKNEARAAATLSHPHIVPVHFVGVERGVHYFAMQLIEGCSLAYVTDQLRREQNDSGYS